MMSGNHTHTNCFLRSRLGQFSRIYKAIVLLCWMALAHTTQAHQTRFSDPRNTTANVHITAGHVPLDARVEENDVQLRSLSSESTWFRIESTSTNKCVAVLNGSSEFDTLIHLTDCDDSDKTLWTQSTDDYYVRSKLDSNKCIVTTGRFLMLKSCPDSVSTRNQVRSSILVTLSTDAAFEAYNDDTIRQRSNSDKCWQAHEIHQGLIELADCGSSDKQHWSATTVVAEIARVKQAAKEAELKARGYEDWMTIQSKSSDKCIAVEGGQALKLAPIVLQDCNPSDDAQLWTHASSRATNDPDHTKIGMIRSKLNPDMCLVPSGSAHGNVPLILWYCDPEEDFGSWTIYAEDSSIRTTRDTTVCLDTFEYEDDVEEDEFKHDVIVGTCPDGGGTTTGQQWITKSAYEHVTDTRVAGQKATAREQGTSEWMTIESKTSGHCLTVEGGEALQLTPIVLEPCEDPSDAQLWEHSSGRNTENPSHVKVGMIRSKLNPEMCLVPSGSAQSNVPLVLWVCDPQESFGAWTMYFDDSSIRTTNNPTVCLDTHELDSDVPEDEFMHDVVVGTCPTGSNAPPASDSQQWVTTAI